MRVGGAGVVLAAAVGVLFTMWRQHAVTTAGLATSVLGTATLDALGLDTTSCTLPRVGELSVEGFRSRFKGRHPVVFSSGAANHEFRRAVGRQQLEALAHVPVILSSSNSFSHDRLHTTLGGYLSQHMEPVTIGRLANETWYLFGDTRGDEWLAMQRGYVHPADSELDDPALSFGVGSKGSGVAFHSHGPAFAETLLGAKRWYLYPPSHRPDFAPDETQLMWAVSRQGAQTEPPLVCTLGPGEVIYLPDLWWHATLNTDDYNAFMSVFTHES